MRFITVTKIRNDRTVMPSASLPAPSTDPTRDTDEPGENGAANEAEQQQDASLLETEPCVINVAAIRCFYPRIDCRPGTRVTFTDGNGFAVTESFDEMSAKVLGEQPQG